MHRLRFLGLIGLLSWLMVGAAGCGQKSQEAAPAGALPQHGSVNDFLRTHWARPLASQGAALREFPARKASIHPADCGACHQAQYEDWRSSLHSRAMGPGVLGQFANMDAGALEEHQECLRCHAPLKEQAESLAAALAAGSATGPAKNPPASALHLQGLVCAACHLRGYQVFGPPRRDGSVPQTAAGFPHGGWSGNRAFEDSGFCAACHQFEPEGFTLNGKLLENTYEEWRASRHAREGRSCQSCHMPERRHLWRGIHDPDMAKGAVTVSTGPAVIDSRRVTAGLTLKNTGAGHYFPTYVTPQLIVQFRQETAEGEVLRDSVEEKVIGRRVAADLSAELSDTRLAPDEQRVIEYRGALHPRAARLVMEIRVEPDAFYTAFYRSLLKDGTAGRGKPLIEAALADSLASRYTLFMERQPLRPAR